MDQSLRKAKEITDARIQFVSLVDKAANQKTFLMKKAKDGTASFTTCGRIIKADAETHHVTGVVYEPMAEDAHGNFMTEDEITKAAYWFAKHGDEVDIQHSFEPFEGAKVVETWVAKADFAIGDEQVKKGTWLMTVEVSDPTIWKSIENGEITGFSMGGVGKYSEEDTDLEAVSKGQGPSEKRSILKRIAEVLGLETVEKGAVTTIFEARSKGTLFWNAFDTLQTVLNHYDPIKGEYTYETDEAKVREALEEFTTIVTDILAGGESITKALQTDRPVAKAGKKMSAANREKLQGVYDTLGTFLADMDDNNNKEDEPVTKEMQDAITQAVAKALEGLDKPAEPAPAPAPTQEPAAPAPAQAPITAEQVQDMVSKAVAAAVEPVLKAKGLPSQLGTEPVEKAAGGEPHYLHGIL